MSAKEKPAREMFEELGYKKTNVIDSERYLFYVSETSEICFNKKHKQVGKQIINTALSNMITFEELQAINKQVEELGWLGDKE